MTKDNITNQRRDTYAVKRCFDVVLTLCGLLITAPFMLIIAVLIKIDSPGPVFFRQERIGKGGRPFILYKFRSMSVDAEKNGPELSGSEDERTTKLGKFMRDHHIDEIPNLWNVLKGDMSIVGYRPERQYFIDKIMKENPSYELLYRTRPGIFSEATLYNGYTDTMEKMLKRLEMDLDYMRRCSIWLDTKIIFLTMVSIFFGKKF